MKARWDQFGRPSISELAILMQNLSVQPTQMLVAVSCAGLVDIAASDLRLDGWAVPAWFIVGGLALSAGIATFHLAAPLFGWLILKKIERDYGAGSARKVVAWHRGAKDGDELNLARIIGLRSENER